MGVSKSLRRLAALTERLETPETEITELAPKNDGLLAKDGVEVDVTVELPFPVGAAQQRDVELTATDVTLTDAGTVSVDLTASVAETADGEALESTDEPAHAPVSGVTDGGTTVDEPASVFPGTAGRDSEQQQRQTASTADVPTIEGSSGVESSTASEEDAPRGRDLSVEVGEEDASVAEEDAEPVAEEGEDEPVAEEGEDAEETPAADADASASPAYKDPERLAAVYDPERTFAEMTEELGVDVTPKTVRHYMVEHGIHEPQTSTSSERFEDGSACPAYKDPERLAAVYDPERTFAEMTEELGVDVTPKTVRHYMVEHGIHEPNADTDSDAAGDDAVLAEAGDEIPEDEIAQAIVDAVELPDDLTLGEVTEAVCTAKTLYEVQRELGIDRDQTHRVLSELDLLELVHGRLSTTSAKSQSREEVERRIQRAVRNVTSSD